MCVSTKFQSFQTAKGEMTEGWIDPNAVAEVQKVLVRFFFLFFFSFFCIYIHNIEKRFRSWSDDTLIAPVVGIMRIL